MSTTNDIFITGQQEAFQSTVESIASRLEGMAERIRRTGQQARRPAHAAAEIISELHTGLANLPTSSMIAYAHEATPTAVPRG